MCHNLLDSFELTLRITCLTQHQAWLLLKRAPVNPLPNVVFAPMDPDLLAATIPPDPPTEKEAEEELKQTDEDAADDVDRADDLPLIDDNDYGSSMGLYQDADTFSYDEDGKSHSMTLRF